MPSNMFADFKESAVYREIVDYINEVLELNRDILEGLKTTDPVESSDMVIGRSKALRDLMSYINTEAELGSLTQEGMMPDGS